MKRGKFTRPAIGVGAARAKTVSREGVERNASRSRMRARPPRWLVLASVSSHHRTTLRVVTVVATPSSPSLPGFTAAASRANGDPAAGDGPGRPTTNVLARVPSRASRTPSPVRARNVVSTLGLANVQNPIFLGSSAPRPLALSTRQTLGEGVGGNGWSCSRRTSATSSIFRDARVRQRKTPSPNTTPRDASRAGSIVQRSARTCLSDRHSMTAEPPQGPMVEATDARSVVEQNLGEKTTVGLRCGASA